MLQYQLHCVDRCVIHIAEGVSKRILYLDTLQQLAQEADKPALTLLTKIHLRSPNVSRARDTASFQQITIPSEQIIEVLKLLAKTGRLFFQKQPLLGGWETVAKIIWKGEESGLFSAAIDWKGKEIALGECSALFPEWCIWQGTVFPLKTPVAWKWVEKFFQGTLLLQGAQKKQFLEEDPPIIWKKQELKKVSLDVFPSLQLTDMTGCFANLWMDYPGVGKVAFEDLCPTVGKELRLKKEEALWEKDLLESGFVRKVVGASRYYCEGNKVHAVLSFLLELGWKVVTKSSKKVLRQSEISWNIQKHPSGAAICADVHFQEMKVPLHQAMQKSHWLDLDGEHVGLIDAKKWESLEGHFEEEKFIVSTSSLLSAFPTLERESTLWDESLLQMIKGLTSDEGRNSPPLGAGFQGTLLPYQQKGVDFLSTLYRWGFSGLLGDEMGLGKTVQVLAFFSTLGKNLQALVIAPSSLLYQWKQEIQKFLKDTPVHVHVGPTRLRDLSPIQGVIITSYALLREDVEILAKPFFEIIVLDESNAIKTSSTQTAKAASALQAKFKIALTGTPIENRAEELASQFAFLMPGFLEKKAGIERLHKRLRPFILRRTKEDVEIELPEKMEQTVWVSMSPRQEEIYKSYQEQVQGGILSKVQSEGIAPHRMEVLEAILRLRQICVDPRLVGEEERGAKLELLLEEIGERKVLIYSQFTTMLQFVGKALQEEGKQFLYLDGKVSPEERAERVKQFQQDPEAKIFLLSLKAGGVGLNLTAAEGVFLLDPWWNEAVESQAIARAHRLGQEKTVIVKRYLSPHSIEEKMLRLKEKKQGLAELLLGGDAFSDVANLTEEDLLHLLT